MAALQPRVQHDVTEHARPEEVAERHQVAAFLRLDPVEPAAQPGLEGTPLYAWSSSG